MSIQVNLIEIRLEYIHRRRTSLFKRNLGVTVDRNDRTVTKIRPIKRHVLHDCMHSSWISIKLTCIDTDPLVSLEFFLFLFQFRIHGGVEVEIWWKIEGEIDA